MAEARTVAVNVVVMVEIFYLFNCRSLTESMFRIGVFSNRWVCSSASAACSLLQLLFTYLPAMNRLFSTAPIPLEAWTRIVVVGLAGYGVVEVEKAFRRWSARRTLGRSARGGPVPFQAERIPHTPGRRRSRRPGRTQLGRQRALLQPRARD